MRSNVILENSRALRGARKIYLGSRVICLLRFLESSLYRIVNGSKALALFKVGNYLKTGSTEILKTITLSTTYQWGHKHCSPMMYRLRKLSSRLTPSRSAWLAFLYDLRRGDAVDLTRRNILFLAFAFLGAFYVTRSVLLILFPKADLLAPWSSGLILGVLITALLWQIKSAGEESSGSSGGLLQNSARAIGRIIEKSRLFIKREVNSIPKTNHDDR